MSQANVDAFLRATGAINRGDIEGMLAELDPAVELHAFLEELLGGDGMVYLGHDGVRDFFRDFNDSFDEFRWEYSDVRDLGDQVLAIGRFHARGRTSGAAGDIPLGVLVDFKGSLATRVWSTADPGDVLRAVGLPR